jgi:Bcr/CflA subfamily drug resistance transporter
MNKIPLTLLIALVGLPQISETIYTPSLPSVTENLNASASWVEMTLSIYFLGFALGVLLWGTISDSIGRRLTMLIGLLIYIVSTFLCGSANSIESLLAWRFVQAFGISVGSVITQTIIRDIYTGDEKVKLFSIISAALAFSPAIGPLVGGFISEQLMWRGNFWFLTLLGTLLFAWTLYLLPETKPEITHKSNRLSLLTLMLKDPSIWGHTLLIGATNGILFGFYQEAPFIFIDQLHISPTQYGLFGLLIAASTLIAARYSYYNPSAPLIFYGSLITLVGSILFSLSIISNIFFTSYGISVSLVLLFLIFFGIGLIIPNSLSKALKAYQHAAGTAGSFFGGFYYILIALFTWALSLMHNGSALPLPLFFTLLSILLFLGSQIISHKEYVNSSP